MRISSSSQHQQQPAAGAASSSSSRSSMADAGCCMLLAVAGCCCLLLLRAWTGTACMNRHACRFSSSSCCCCVRACVRGRLRDRQHIPADATRRRRPGRGESNFRIEIFMKNQYGQKDEFGTPCVSRARLLSVLILLEYFYTEIRFSTPALSALLSLACCIKYTCLF